MIHGSWQNRLGVSCFGVLAALVGACGGQNKAAPPPTTATQPVETTSATISRLEGERDAAKQAAAAADERARADERQLAVDHRTLAGVRERNTFERDVASKLAGIDTRLQTLQSDIPRVAAAKRAKLQGAVRDLTARRDAIDRELRQAHAVPVNEWHDYALNIDTRIDRIDLDIQALEAKK